MRTLTVITAFVALWFAGCSTKRATLSQRVSALAVRSSDARQITMSVTNWPPPFRQYDQQFIRAVQNRWEDLLGAVAFNRRRTGEVILAFKLHADGRITDLEVKKNSVSAALGVLCQKAILDPQPYERWSPEMQVLVGADFRLITFSFYYK